MASLKLGGIGFLCFFSSLSYVETTPGMLSAILPEYSHTIQECWKEPISFRGCIKCFVIRHQGIYFEFTREVAKFVCGTFFLM